MRDKTKFWKSIVEHDQNTANVKTTLMVYFLEHHEGYVTKIKKNAEKFPLLRGVTFT